MGNHQQNSREPELPQLDNLNRRINEQKRNFLVLLDQRLKASIDRAWAVRLDGAAIAIEQAREKVARVLRSQLIYRPSSSKALGTKVLSGMLSLEALFPSLPPTQSEVSDAIERSRTDFEVFQALRIFAGLGFSKQFPSLKVWERDLVFGLVIEPHLRKGPSTFRDAQRNMLIVSQVFELRVAGFKPTRNEATSAHTSGCDIVADVMTGLGHSMTYSAVEAVWKNRDKVPKPKLAAKLLAESIMDKARDQDEAALEK